MFTLNFLFIHDFDCYMCTCGSIDCIFHSKKATPKKAKTQSWIHAKKRESQEHQHTFQTFLHPKFCLIHSVLHVLASMFWTWTLKQKQETKISWESSRKNKRNSSEMQKMELTLLLQHNQSFFPAGNGGEKKLFQHEALGDETQTEVRVQQWIALQGQQKLQQQRCLLQNLVLDVRALVLHLCWIFYCVIMVSCFPEFHCILCIFLVFFWSFLVFFARQKYVFSLFCCICLCAFLYVYPAHLRAGAAASAAFRRDPHSSASSSSISTNETGNNLALDITDSRCTAYTSFFCFLFFLFSPLLRLVWTVPEASHHHRLLLLLLVLFCLRLLLHLHIQISRWWWWIQHHMVLCVYKEWFSFLCFVVVVIISSVHGFLQFHLLVFFCVFLFDSCLFVFCFCLVVSSLLSSSASSFPPPPAYLQASGLPSSYPVASTLPLPLVPGGGASSMMMLNNTMQQPLLSLPLGMPVNLSSSSSSNASLPSFFSQTQPSPLLSSSQQQQQQQQQQMMMMNFGMNSMPASLLSGGSLNIAQNAQMMMGTTTAGATSSAQPWITKGTRNVRSTKQIFVRTSHGVHCNPLVVSLPLWFFAFVFLCFCLFFVLCFFLFFCFSFVLSLFLSLSPFVLAFFLCSFDHCLCVCVYMPWFAILCLCWICLSVFFYALIGLFQKRKRLAILFCFFILFACFALLCFALLCFLLCFVFLFSCFLVCFFALFVWFFCLFWFVSCFVCFVCFVCLFVCLFCVHFSSPLLSLCFALHLLYVSSCLFFSSYFFLVCFFLYIHVYTHIHIYTYTHIYTHIHTYTHIYTHIHACVHIYTLHSCIHTSWYIYVTD